MRDPEKILADDPGSVVFSRYAEQLSRDGRFDQAMDVLQRGIRANPFHAPGYSVLADLLFQLESVEEAVENILSALELDPQMPRDLFRLGTQYLERDPFQAEPFLKAALAYAPDSVEVAVSLGKVSQQVNPSPDYGDISLGEVELPVLGVPDTGVDDDTVFDELGASALDVIHDRDPFRKTSVSIEQEDRDFLALMGEPGVGTIDEELDSLFQTRESQTVQMGARQEPATETDDLETAPLVMETPDQGNALHVKPPVPEIGLDDLTGDDDESEHPSDARSFDTLPLGVLDDDSLIDEKESLEGYAPQPVEEMGVNADFFDAHPEHEEAETEDDLDTLFDSLSLKQTRSVPDAKGEAREPEEDETGEPISRAGNSAIPGKTSHDGTEEITVEEQPVEYGIADPEKEAEAEAVLEITDEEEYSLARFGFDSVPEEDLPVLSDAERTELMALTVPRGGGTEEDEADGERSVEEATENDGEIGADGEIGTAREGLGLGDLSLEDLEKPDDLGEELIDESSVGLVDTVGGTGSSVLTSGDSVDEINSEDLAGEGIDYSDVLSAWMPQDEKIASPPEMEPETFSISEIMENLTESGDETPDSEDLKEETPDREEPVDDSAFPDLIEDGPEIPVTGASDLKLKAEFPEMGNVREIVAFSAEPLGLTSPFEEETVPTKSGGGEGAGSFALPMMEGLFDMGRVPRPLTDEQTELIDDFLSGKEPESDSDASVSAFSFPADSDLHTLAPESFSLPIETRSPGDSGETGLLSEPEESPGGEISAFTPEPDPAFSFAAGEGGLSSISPDDEITPVPDASVELPDIEALMQSPATEISHESLGDLIDQYQDMMTTPATIPLQRVPKMHSSIPPSAMTNPPPAFGQEPKARSASKPRGSYTATMAEIYVSQGLITRAIDIYTVLAENNPDSGQYGNRLLELKRMHEQQPDAS